MIEVSQEFIEGHNELQEFVRKFRDFMDNSNAYDIFEQMDTKCKKCNGEQWADCFDLSGKVAEIHQVANDLFYRKIC